MRDEKPHVYRLPLPEPLAISPLWRPQSLMLDPGSRSLFRLHVERTAVGNRPRLQLQNLAGNASTSPASAADIDIYWLPRGAGGHSVRLNDVASVRARFASVDEPA